MLKKEKTRSLLMRYVSAVLVVVPAAELKLLLAPLIQEVSLFLLFFGDVMLSAFVGGAGGAIRNQAGRCTGLVLLAQSILLVRISRSRECLKTGHLCAVRELDQLRGGGSLFGRPMVGDEHTKDLQDLRRDGIGGAVDSSRKVERILR
jgi:hypothetical protein